MLKENQTVLLPIHEQLGKVIYVDCKKAVIRVTLPEETYDVIVTPEGLLPHTDVSLVQGIIFVNDENAFIKKDNVIILGKITNIRVKNKELICDFISGITEPTKIIEETPLDYVYKLFSLKKTIDKLCRQNDRFHKKD